MCMYAWLGHLTTFTKVGYYSGQQSIVITLIIGDKEMLLPLVRIGLTCIVAGVWFGDGIGHVRVRVETW